MSAYIQREHPLPTCFSFFFLRFAGWDRFATAGLMLCVSAGLGAGHLKINFVRKSIFEAHLQLVKYWRFRAVSRVICRLRASGTRLKNLSSYKSELWIRFTCDKHCVSLLEAWQRWHFLRSVYHLIVAQVSRCSWLCDHYADRTTVDCSSDSSDGLFCHYFHRTTRRLHSNKN